MEDIVQWMASNRLKLNLAKTDFIWCHWCATHRCQHQLSKDHVTFGGSDIQPWPAIIDCTRSRSHTGLGTVVRTSYQPVTQPLLPVASPYKDLHARALSMGKRSSQQLHYIQNWLLQQSFGQGSTPRYQLDRLAVHSEQCNYWSAPRSTTTLNMCCWTIFTGFRFRNVSSSSCACWRSRRCMD